MIEKLMELIKEHGAEAIYNNDTIPADKKDAAVKVIAAGIAHTLKTHTDAQGVEGITDMITSGNVSPELMDAIEDSVASKLVLKLGMDLAHAQAIASSIVPAVMGKLTEHSNNGFDLKNILIDVELDIAAFFNNILA